MPLVITVTAAMLLAACGSGGGDLPEGAGEHQPGSACEEAVFADTMSHIFVESDTALKGIESFTCSGDWAVVTLNLEQAEEGVSNLVVFKRDGDAWILKAPETVCGTVTTPGARPADAEIAEDLWEQACASL